MNATHATVAPVTDADRRQALHDTDTPHPVKRALKQYFYGRDGGRREVRHDYTRTHEVRAYSGPARTLKAVKPEGVSGRQWRKQRKAVRRIQKALGERAA